LKIILLGNRGFIGSKLENFFQVRGYEILILNNLDFLHGSKAICLFESVEVIINCIGSASVGSSYSNTNDDFESNFDVVRRVLEILRLNNFSSIKYINLSSAAVYGNPKNLPVHEWDATQPLSPYGFHKFMAEVLLKEYSQCFGLKTVSLRIFSAFGNGQKKLLLWDLHEKIQKSNGNIILFGTGNETRDFIHIEDIAQQILLAINNADFLGEAINVANGKEVKISEVVELYQKYYPKKFDYEFNGEVRLGDPLNWCADISTMRNWCYRQNVLLNDGIYNYIEYLVGE
jgi:UDP-glucose 4-epimerase